MYHPTVIQCNLEKLEPLLGFKLVRYSAVQSAEYSEPLLTLRRDDGSLKRQLSREENEFIRNERIMCKWDYFYWRERYFQAELDGVEGGGIGRMRIWESQRILLDLIAKCQLEQDDAFQRGEPVDGILITDHKARQVGHTQEVRALNMHRSTLWNNSRGAAISVDADKIHELYRRDKLILQYLPWFLKTKLDYDEKDGHIQMAGTGSWINYMQESMKSSLGQGIQHDIAHLTEVSEWQFPHTIDSDFLPSLPQSPMTLCIAESRANGRGNYWHRFTESVRCGRQLRWRYCFVPWYAEPKKYRRMPLPNWVPSEVSLLHAKKVYAVSPEFIGKNVTLSKEQLYWWESTRAEHMEKGELNYFLASYCSNPEESFQHVATSAFDAELLERLRNKASWGRAYEAQIGAAA